MSIGPKSINAQAFRLMLYHRALHPELFGLQRRRNDRHGDYEVESWLTTVGHVVRFQVDGRCMTEVVIEQGDHLPETGLVHALPCLGEKEFELVADDGNLGYVTALQTEVLTDNLYQATLREMQSFAHETGAITYEWEDAEGITCLSMLDSQKYRREYHFQAYHLLGASGTVLRTQSIFEIGD